MDSVMQVGVIGCGNISGAYFNAGKQFRSIRFKSCADLNPEASAKAEKEAGIHAVTVPELLADPEIGIVLNLTTPQSHTEVNTRILEAGKHSYSEKPFGLSLESAAAVNALAEQRGLRTGSAPDTFLGGSHQTCRKLIDDNWLGEVTNGVAFMQTRGHEFWHPAPEFYYRKGGGPVLDMGPYYVTALVNLLGPVRRVVALSNRAYRERRILSQPKAGEPMPVEVNTHTAGVLEFESGALVTMIMSFDVPCGDLPNIELNGTRGSLKVPDPNCFGGEIRFCARGEEQWQTVPALFGYRDNMRSLGLADMAKGIQSGRPHRCNGRLAYHVLEVLLALEEAGSGCGVKEIVSRCERPAPLAAGLIHGELD